MKKFYFVLLSVLLIVFTAALFAIPANALYGGVVFIADGGTGDGSSPDSPLAAADSGMYDKSATNKKLYFDSPLYQAAQILKGAPGTIVICGEFTIDDSQCYGNSTSIKDFRMPSSESHYSLTITSVYNGVDYRETNGARLIIQTPACIQLGGRTVFENITLSTMQSPGGIPSDNRVIAANGYPLTLGEGIECVPLDASGNPMINASAAKYPSIIGGHRYDNSSGDCDVTILSGTYYTLCAGNWGIDSSSFGVLTGDTTLTVGGSATILGPIYGTNRDDTNATVQAGNTVINFTGGTFSGHIYAAGSGRYAQAGYTSEINIFSGDFSSCKGIIAERKTIVGSPADTYTLNCVSYKGDVDFLSKAKGFTEIVYPYSTVTSVSLESNPIRNTYFTGDYFNPRGLSVNAEYNGKTSIVKYEDCPSAFAFSHGVSSPFKGGENEVAIYYGTHEVSRFTVTINNRPQIYLEGAQIKIDGQSGVLGSVTHDDYGVPSTENQGLRFISKIEKDAYGISTADSGIIVIPTEFISSPKDLNFEYMAGFANLSTSGYILRSELNDENYSNLYDLDDCYYSGSEILNIPVEEYTTRFTAVAYYKFVYEGVEYIAYSEPIERSVYSVALAAVRSAEPQKNKDFLKANVIYKVENNIGSTFSQKKVDERIDGILGYMEKMGSIEWYTPVNIDFSKEASYTTALKYTANKTYTGIPYLDGNNKYVNYEQFMDVLNGSKRYNGPYGYDTMYGNQCLHAVNLSATRFLSFFPYSVTSSCYPSNGALFFTDSPIDYSGAFFYTKQVYNASGTNDNQRKQNIFEMYARSKKGDIFWSHWLDGKYNFLGHIRMAYDDPVIHRNADGTINGARSYCILAEHQSSNSSGSAESTWRFNYKYTFDQLVSSTGPYLCARPVAYTTGYFETHYSAVTGLNSADDIKDGIKGNINSNYDIFLIYADFKNKSTGETVLRIADYPSFIRTYDLSALDKEDQLSSLPAGDYVYVLTIGSANDQKVYAEIEFSK